MRRFIYLLVLAMVYGCIYDDLECRPQEAVSVTLSVYSDGVEFITRPTEEGAVSDVNIFLFSRSSSAALHVYSPTSIFTFTCMPDEYEVFAITNMHEDLGEFSRQQLETFTTAYNLDFQTLPMIARTEIRIASGISSLTLPPLEVRRAVAKVSCNISVLPEDMELLSAQLLSVPRMSHPFDVAARPSAADDDYTDTDVLPLGGRQASVEYYLLPNAQGENAAITDQRQKDAANAPAHASFLRLRAQRGDRVLTYAVYLGENNTTNFDVLANRHYRLNISILGDHDLDTRMSAYTVRVWDDFDDYNHGGYCLLDGTRYLHVDVECYDGTAPVCGHLEVLSGDTRSFTFNYGDTGPSHDFDIYDMTGDNEYEMEYYVAGYNDANALLAYRVTLTDAYGFTRSYDFEHRMANAVYVETTGAGMISAAAAQHVEPHAGNREDRTLVLFASSSVQLTATAAEGMTFAGWYADSRHEELLSSDPEYLYMAQAPLRYLYALFRPGEKALDMEGTANCYIAPELGQSYSFDATVMGNGRPTLNIEPRPLAGASARLIWESGTRAHAVIASVELVDGRIRLRAGTQYGNALVGLYDSRGECLWSWHIWVADYMPDAGSQTYASGARFMDRNLGASEAECSDSSACGLYYQWGRKDPFPYPAAFATRTAPAAFTYYDGYTHTSIHPEEHEAAAVMTTAWAAGHPTTFIHAADYDIDQNEEDILDWLHAPHHNLWGNRTLGMPMSREINKSIYDPCPPGWRVPDAWDFRGISYARQQLPRYVEIVCNGTRTARYPACGTFDGETFSGVGEYAQLFTNAPYFWVLAQQTSFFDGVSCTALRLTTVPLSVDEKRFKANPVRCVKE